MDFVCYKLNFTAPLHVAEEGLGLEEASEVLHSDTLMGAIINAWSLLYPGEDLEGFITSAPFTVSSAFPYIGDLLFFPRPMLRIGSPQSAKEEDPSIGKKLKKIRFMSKPLFEKVIKGEGIDPSRLEIIEGFAHTAPFEPPCKSTEIPRVSLDRISSASAFFYFRQIYFHPEGGLWFMAKFNGEAETESKLEGALEFLGDHGLGADRSVGKGFFRATRSNTEINPPEGSGQVLLSLCHPTEEDFAQIRNHPLTKYTLVERRGWVTSPHGGRGLRQKPVRMFGEGSVFACKVVGRITRVLTARPNQGLHHNVYRWGRAFTLPCMLEDDHG